MGPRFLSDHQSRSWIYLHYSCDRLLENLVCFHNIVEHISLIDPCEISSACCHPVHNPTIANECRASLESPTPAHGIERLKQICLSSSHTAQALVTCGNYVSLPASVLDSLTRRVFYRVCHASRSTSNFHHLTKMSTPYSVFQLHPTVCNLTVQSYFFPHSHHLLRYVLRPTKAISPHTLSFNPNTQDPHVR